VAAVALGEAGAGPGIRRPLAIDFAAIGEARR
jgi:hypothetical protein